MKKTIPNPRIGGKTVIWAACAALLWLAFVPAAAQAAPADGSARAEPGSETCRYAQDRADAGILRARRAVARVNIAAKRVSAELAEVGRTASSLDGLELEPPPPQPENSGFREVADLSWDLKRYAEKVSHLAQAEMSRLMRPIPASAELGPTLEDEEESLFRPKDENEASCLRWAVYIERAAFRAEQAAQLADVAAIQAITFSDHELRNPSE